MEKHTPSHLAQKSRQSTKRPILPRLLGGLAAAAVMLLLLGFIAVFASYQSSAAGLEPPDTSDDVILTDTLEEQQNIAQAIAQAEATALEASEQLMTPPSTLEEVEGITVDLIPLNEYSRPGVALDCVNAIVIHYTGNPGSTAQQNRDYFASLAESGEESVSSHFVIGMDGAIIQCIPLDEKSYCTNHRNSDTISIECCHPDDSGEFTPETREALVKLVRYLVNGYGLDEEGIIRHYDVTGKCCPRFYVEHEDEWEALKADILQTG